MRTTVFDTTALALLARPGLAPPEALAEALVMLSAAAWRLRTAGQHEVADTATAVALEAVAQHLRTGNLENRLPVIAGLVELAGSLVAVRS